MILANKYILDTTSPIKYETFIFKLDSLCTITSITNLSNSTQAEIYVYPNPATSTFHFVMQNISKGSVIKMYNMAGMQVKEIWVNETNRCETDISQLLAGIYTY